MQARRRSSCYFHPFFVLQFWKWLKILGLNNACTFKNLRQDSMLRRVSKSLCSSHLYSHWKPWSQVFLSSSAALAFCTSAPCWRNGLSVTGVTSAAWPSSCAVSPCGTIQIKRGRGFVLWARNCRISRWCQPLQWYSFLLRWLPLSVSLRWPDGKGY